MKVIELIEKTVKVDNSDNAERQYNIFMNITLRNGTISSVFDGHVRTLDGNVEYAYFNGLNSLNVNFDSMAKDRAAILAAIEEFEAALDAEELL